MTDIQTYRGHTIGRNHNQWIWRRNGIVIKHPLLHIIIEYIDQYQNDVLWCINEQPKPRGRCPFTERDTTPANTPHWRAKIDPEMQGLIY